MRGSELTKRQIRKCKIGSDFFYKEKACVSGNQCPDWGFGGKCKSYIGVRDMGLYFDSDRQ